MLRLCCQSQHCHGTGGCAALNSRWRPTSDGFISQLHFSESVHHFHLFQVDNSLAFSTLAALYSHLVLELSHQLKREPSGLRFGTSSRKTVPPWLTAATTSSRPGSSKQRAPTEARLAAGPWGCVRLARAFILKADVPVGGRMTPKVPGPESLNQAFADGMKLKILQWITAPGPTFKVSSEEEGRGRLRTHTEDSCVTIEADTGGMRPQATGRLEPPAGGEAGRTLPCSLWRQRGSVTL